MCGFHAPKPAEEARVRVSKSRGVLVLLQEAFGTRGPSACVLAPSFVPDTQLRP